MSKISQLTEDTTPTHDDLIETVTDPAGTPLSRKAKLSSIFSVFQQWVFGADAGSNDTYVVTLSPAPAAYVTGQHYRFKANTANTGVCTVNFNGLGAKTIKKAAGGVTTDLADNDIRAGQWVDLVYDGTNFQMQSQLGNTGLVSEDIQDIVGAMFQDGDINFNYDDSGNIETNVLQNQFKTSLLVFEFGDGKSTTSLEVDQVARIPYVLAGTIVRARIEGDASGSAVVDIRKSTADPPSYSSICASAKPTLSSDIFADDTTLTGWSTSLAAGNGLLAVLESVTTCKQVTVVLEIRKS